MRKKNVTVYCGASFGVDERYQEIEKDFIEKNIRGITISGGEPFLQMVPLKNLIKKIKEKINLDIICFTGFSYEELLKKGDKDINYILNNIDILIDGKYIEEKNENNYLRGSSNQNIIFLSDRYKVYENDMKNLKNRNVEYTWKNEKEMFIIGIPHKNMEEK